jgi:hypothetical protein
MAEQFAQVFKGDASAASGDAYVDWIAATLIAGSRWFTDESVAGKALLENATTGAQIVLWGTAALTGNQGQVAIGFAPDGGVTDWDTAPTASVWSGMRNIMGSTSLITTADTRLALAVYEDALAIIIRRSTSYFRIAMIGSIFTPLDDSDRALNIGVDGMLLGVPANQNSSGNWIAGNNSPAFAGHCSVVRVKDEFVRLASTNRSIPPSLLLDRASGVERFVPHLVHQLTSAGTIGSTLAATKYLRQWRALLPHETRLFSDTLGSEQAWTGWSAGGTTADNNQVILWAQTEVNA